MNLAALEAATAELAATSPSARLDAELLLACVLGIDRGQLLARLDARLPPAQAVAYRGLIRRRTAGEPVAYIVGYREFWSLRFEAGPGALVPRPDSELLVELALALLEGTESPAVADLGAGSGAIGCAIASERPDARVELVDVSEAALALAERNRTRLGLGNARTRHGSWYEPLGTARYALLVSNPPYLAATDPHLASPELSHEPRSALVAGPTGLEAIKALAAGAGEHLLPRGTLLLEHGAGQGAAVRACLRAAGLEAVATRRDLASLERATFGSRPG